MPEFSTKVEANRPRGQFEVPGKYLCRVLSYSEWTTGNNHDAINVRFECVHKPLRAMTTSIFGFEGPGTNFTGELLESVECETLSNYKDDKELSAILGNKLVVVTLRKKGNYLNVARVTRPTVQARQLARHVGYWNEGEDLGSIRSDRDERKSQSASSSEYGGDYDGGTREDDIPF